MKFSFLRKRWFWITTGAVVIVGGFVVHAHNANKGPFYETATVTKQDLMQTVEVTGEVSPQDRIDLSFKASGRLVNVPVIVGQRVKQGDLLAQEDAKDLQFALQRAGANMAMLQAQLQSRLAGETKESIRIAQAGVDQAQASYDKAVNDLASMRQTVQDQYSVSQIALSTAQNNLQNSGASLDQAVGNAYDTLRNGLQTSQGSIQTALADGDTIIGVDNSAANDSYENILGLNDRASLMSARLQYPVARASQALAVSAVQALNSASSQTDIRAASSAVQDALSKTQLYLDYVQRTLAGTITNGNLTPTDLAAKKALIDGDRVAVSAQLSAVIGAQQTVTTSELTRTTTRTQLQDAVSTAQKNLDIADKNRTTNVQTAETSVAIQLAALNSAKASLSAKLAPPRAVDLASLRAQIQDAGVAYQEAQNNLQNAQIVAPTDGVVTNIGPAIGEQIAMNTPVVTMIGNEKFKVEGLVPEADIAKVKVGQTATMTLDAFGDNVKFTGTVLSEDPDQTKVQDAIYYKVHVGIDSDNADIKPGMTANVTILTDERHGVLVIPSRALRQQDQAYSVRVLDHGVAQDVVVTIGLRGDEGRVEVLSGLTEGQQVITGELTAQEYAASKATATSSTSP